MKKSIEKNSKFDDIVFENRNKKYGAYILRTRYNQNVLFSILIGTIIIVTVVITPYLNAKSLETKHKQSERQVEIKMENLDQPNDQIAPPPPPPPADVMLQQKYIPPEVVDSVKPEDMKQLMTADQAQVEVKNEEAVEVVAEVKEEIQDLDTEVAPFVVVEESPEFPGGINELLKYIGLHLNYPEIARENNIQGKVIIKFCVTSKGGVNQVSILKGVDPALDAEAVRVVTTLPTFKPGKQGGKPVPVWFLVPIVFAIK
jgi:periplasmic protein TonB